MDKGASIYDTVTKELNRQTFYIFGLSENECHFQNVSNRVKSNQFFLLVLLFPIII